MSINRRLLPHESPFDLQDRESARIESFLAPLVAAGDDDPAWKAPTRCSDWDARALFGHLRHLEDYNQAGMNDTVSELLSNAGDHDFDGYNAAGVQRYADVPVARLFEDWRRLNADYRAQMRDRGDGFVDTSVGKYPSLFQAYYLAVEYAAHGDDFGIEGTYDGRDAWRAAFARFALTEQERPVVLDVGDGTTDVGYQDATYVVSDHDLAEAAVARLGPESGLPADVRATLRCCA